jgi:hypothetical protein
MTRLLALYPRWWRDRYGDEMRALLELAPPRPSDRVDLARGALDAWLHPPEPSRLPALAAFLGGGLWTVAAVGVVVQPVPPDWPGYLADVIAVALVAVGCLLVALVGVAVRAADTGGRLAGLAVGLAVVGYGGWFVSLAWTATGGGDGVALWASQAIAMVATAALGAVLVRTGEDRIGTLVLVAACALLVPWTVMWLVFGACWTAIGMVLIVDRGAAARPIDD